MSDRRKIRCAIYARTSTEEGLAQEFNSLDAQIEACRAYIISQAGEGWTAHKETFVDGGFSGGSLERPALKRLLAAVAARSIDTIVVYKVDRLTRSLSDFAKIVETLDNAKASFVSVTQSFNTTTSMGRLTLNVLLSFAQFEREVTGERIRDKIAASKAKGMWMGGSAPLGYDVRDRGLVVNEPEAERVRLIFHRFLELGSIAQLARELRDGGIFSKGWTSRSGRVHESGPISLGALALILANPIYQGRIRHRDKTYPGRHVSIVDDALWDAAQVKRASLKPPSSELPQHIDGAMLSGRVQDDCGNAMRISFTRKGSRRYRYYVSAALLDGHGEVGSLARISAGTLDRTVLEEVAPLLAPSWRAHWPIESRILAGLKQVTISARKLCIELAAEAVDEHVETRSGSGVTHRGDAIIFERAIALARPRNASTILNPMSATGAQRMDRALVRAVALAHVWSKKLESGEVGSVVDLAETERRCLQYTTKLLPLAYLAPDLVAMIVEGRQPRALTLSALLAKPLPLDWSAQRALVSGFA